MKSVFENPRANSVFGDSNMSIGSLKIDEKSKSVLELQIKKKVKELQELDKQIQEDSKILEVKEKRNSELIIGIVNLQNKRDKFKDEHIKLLEENEAYILINQQEQERLSETVSRSRELESKANKDRKLTEINRQKSDQIVANQRLLEYGHDVTRGHIRTILGDIEEMGETTRKHLTNAGIRDSDANAKLYEAKKILAEAKEIEASNRDRTKKIKLLEEDLDKREAAIKAKEEENILKAGELNKLSRLKKLNEIGNG